MSKGKEASATKAVLEYLIRQNRPYSAIDIFSNLHKEYGKTQVVKSCEQLTQEGKVREKLYGKQKVYVVDQSQFADVDDAEIKKMDQEIVEMSSNLRDYHDACKKMDSELKSLSSAIGTEEAIAQCKQLEQQINSKETKLKVIKDSGDLVTPEEREEVMTQRANYVKIWKKRKRLANDILNAILEGYPKTKKQLYEEIGIETDEEYKVAPPEV
ncbi:homologous-pairing protein 2 homolog [Tubulanus polymorphus]|uniref:homologous-pairing protein 2 homolog n=1 Tax=Tubulanus polymorphus TaxID=672921 RepID=UPI003DA49BE2